MGTADITDIIVWAESQGWTVEVDENGYRRFFDPAGNYIVLTAEWERRPGRPPRVAHGG